MEQFAATIRVANFLGRYTRADLFRGHTVAALFASQPVSVIAKTQA
jgi:hypothetical protein